MADLSPPWILLCEGGKPIAILPTGRPGEVLNVEGWPLDKALALIDAANQESASFNARMTKATERLLELNARSAARLRADEAEPALSAEPWIRCSERMPETDAPIWFVLKGAERQVRPGERRVRGGELSAPADRDDELASFELEAMTHWMPRTSDDPPAPPSEEEP